MGLDQNTFERKGAVGIGEALYNIAFYGLTDNQFRPPGAAGNMALHYYPLPHPPVRGSWAWSEASAGRRYATRPVAILDLGWLKLKGGVEYQHIGGQQASDETDMTSKGVGGAVQFVFDPHVEFGFNAAQGTIVAFDPRASGPRAASRAPASAGSPTSPTASDAPSDLRRRLAVHANVDQNAVVTRRGRQLVAVSGLRRRSVRVIQQLYVKLVGGYSRGHWLTAGNDPPIAFDDEMYSVRLRFSYYF